MNRFPGIFACCLLLISAGCKLEPPPDPAIGEAYAGPATLPLRQDIAPQSALVATVHHGDRLEILQHHRRFVKVRTAKRAEGWTDERLLLSPEELANIRRLGEQSKSAPSLGIATTYETLNVHSTPDRQSPSFLQIKEGEKVDVIGRRISPRLSPPPPRLPRPATKERSRKQAKESRKSKQIPPPPMPPPPPPPKDWMQLSTLSFPSPTPPPPAEGPKPVAMDDWSLIRNSAGESGWVLTRRLVMAIPDEVAQYAEGRRITSYFPLGETHDGANIKRSWFWTTVERGLTPYDFDSFRVFVWSPRRHRYETAHIERNLIGYFPALRHPVPAPRARGSKAHGESSNQVPGFSVVIEKKDGRRYRRNYAFVDNTVRLSSEEPVNPGSQPVAPESGRVLVASTEPQAAQPEGLSFYGRLRNQLGAWRKQLFGR